MKKFGLLLAGGVAAIVAIANFGPMIGLAISAAILYYAVKGFLLTDSTCKKILWVLIGLAALGATLSNMPALFGVVAIGILYLVYKKWNEQPSHTQTPEDPFTNFEKQWDALRQS